MIKYLVKHTKGFLDYKDLLVQLVSRDLKLKYRRSVLGYLWSVLSPLMIMAVQVVVFQYMFRSLVLYHTLPEWDMVLAGCAASLIVLLGGAWCFVRKQDDFILYI